MGEGIGGGGWRANDRVEPGSLRRLDLVTADCVGESARSVPRPPRCRAHDAAPMSSATVDTLAAARTHAMTYTRRMLRAE